MHPPASERPHQSPQKLRLIERLATGKGDPAGGRLEEIGIPQHLRHHLLHAPVLPHFLQRTRRAGIDTGITARARIGIITGHNLLPAGRPLRAHPCATTAPRHTALLPQKQLRRQLQPLRIVAPGAVQRAPLQENRGADSRAVIQRELLNIEDHSGRTGHRANSAREIR